MAHGFFTDTTLCIGCKACEVACKQWNQLPAEDFELTGMSYDNTVQLGATTWRHVSFIEQFDGKGRFNGLGQEALVGAGAGAMSSRGAGASAISGNISQTSSAPTQTLERPASNFLTGNRWLMM